MVMSNLQALSLIAAAQHVVSTGGDAPAELRCQYPSKRCDLVRTTKRGGGLHRLCTYHRERANKNQWLVDQRRRARRDGVVVHASSSNASASPRSSSKKAIATLSCSPAVCAVDDTIMDALDLMDMEAIYASLGDADLEVLHALFFDGDDDDELSIVSEFSDDCFMDASIIDWAF